MGSKQNDLTVNMDEEDKKKDKSDIQVGDEEQNKKEDMSGGEKLTENKSKVHNVVSDKSVNENETKTTNNEPTEENPEDTQMLPEDDLIEIINRQSDEESNSIKEEENIIGEETKSHRKIQDVENVLSIDQNKIPKMDELNLEEEQDESQDEFEEYVGAEESTMLDELQDREEEQTILGSISGITDQVRTGEKVTKHYSKKSVRTKYIQVTKHMSIAYEFGPRFKDDFDIQRPSGQFVLGVDEDQMTYYPYMEAEEEGQEESSVDEKVESYIEIIDRQEYYQKHKDLQDQSNMYKIENNLLLRKLSSFFKRKKLEHVLRESAQHTYDTTQNYYKYLDVYKQTVDDSTRMRNDLTKELEVLKNKRDNKLQELDRLFKSMQEREKEIGFGLINTKTGKPIPDKLVERLINRQRIQMGQVSGMRLKYILLKDMVAIKQQAIADLDNIGDGLRLRDYEQLKVENRSYADKLEEKDEELTRLRFKCQNTIQILAHIREKSSALDADIDDLKDDRHSAEIETFEIRERLNDLKHERDQTRITIDKMRMESGLLAEPILLRDMQNSMTELTAIKNELEHIKAENKIKAQQIRNIRKNIEQVSEEAVKNLKETVIKKKPIIMSSKTRPSIFKPTLPLNAFAHLK